MTSSEVGRFCSVVVVVVDCCWLVLRFGKAMQGKYVCMYV